MERKDRDSRYSEPCYYDTEQDIWVNERYEPVELPVTRNLLHGGESGFDRPATNNEMDEETTQESGQKVYQNVYKVDKYKGVQFKDTLTVPAFQAFKSVECSHTINQIVQESTN